MNGTKLAVLSVSGCILLACSIVFGRQQDRELAGIHGLPVEGHDTVASVEIAGTKQIHLHKIHERLRSNGADVRLGLPLESQTLCRFKEVLRDVLRERGFPDAEITHEARPTWGDRRHLTLTFTITEGKRSRPVAPAAPMPSPAERCLR